MVIKTYNIQLPKNLMYLGLHPPKHGKLHPCENFHYVNICHLHIGQWGEPKFYPQIQILHKCIVSSLWAKPINVPICCGQNQREICSIALYVTCTTSFDFWMSQVGYNIFLSWLLVPSIIHGSPLMWLWCYLKCTIQQVQP
jgi:hypothetical protein